MLFITHKKKYIYQEDEKDKKGFSLTFLRKNPLIKKNKIED
jgi:hypothetical protein